MPVSVHDPAQVAEDVGLRREPPAPPVLGSERERVEVRRDVAGRARVDVVPPDAADLVTAFEHHDLRDVRGVLVPQGDGRGETAEPGTDHGDSDGHLTTATRQIGRQVSIDGIVSVPGPGGERRERSGNVEVTARVVPTMKRARRRPPEGTPASAL
jgi:hypothetical protein